MRDQDRAKAVLIEIMRLYGGAVNNKIHLFKTFYFAHLYYARSAPDYLSDWPIVRMPLGPGIGDSDELIDSLVQDGDVEVSRVEVGPFLAYRYQLLRDEIPSSLSLEAIGAIRDAVEFTKHKSASELSEITHQYSRSWQEAEDGAELNIYIDLLDANEYAIQKEKADRLAAAVKNSA
jgi:hypothetical protein